MGLFKDLKVVREIAKEERKKAYLNSTFKSFTAYAPSFTTYAGGVYEMALCRAAIHSIANQVSKANPVVNGDKYKSLQSILQNRPNALMTGQQYLYKLTTIMLAENTCFIIPIYEDRSAGKIIGYWPVSPSGSKIKRLNFIDYLEYKVVSGDGSSQSAVIPLDEVGIVRRHYGTNDYYGESNKALDSTMNLINIQEQGIIEGIKNSNSIRFMMKLANTMATPAKFKEERDRIRDLNLGSDNNGGIFVYDNKYENAQQIDSKPLIVDAEQTRIIQENVNNYFGTFNEFIQNKFTETQWDAIYEGNIEPILIQYSQVHTRMTFTEKDVDANSFILFEASKLQYASNETKLKIVTSLFDRGFFTHNDGRDVFNMSHVEGGDKYFIRREYVEVNKLGDVSKGLVSPKEGDPLEGATVQ